MNNWMILLVLSLLAGCTMHQTTHSTTTTGYAQERNRPHPLHQGEMRSGIEIYEAYCLRCHGRNTQGAPIPGDHHDWNKRSKQGREVLILHALEGYGDLMPRKGGCLDCRDAEVIAAMEYMITLKDLRLDIKPEVQSYR